MRYVKVRRFKRGAKWPNGEVRLCTRCGSEQLTRRRQANLVADIKEGTMTVPVSFCAPHIPEELRT